MLAAGARGIEAGGKDAGVVQDEEVAGAEEMGQVAEGVVVECSCRAVDAEHAAGAADGGRVLRNQLSGKVEVEVGDEHG